jgi:hypothetical protein
MSYERIMRTTVDRAYIPCSSSARGSQVAVYNTFQLGQVHVWKAQHCKPMSKSLHNHILQITSHGWSRRNRFKTNNSILTLQPASGYVCCVCISARLVTSLALFLFQYFLRPLDLMSQDGPVSTKSTKAYFVRIVRMIHVWIHFLTSLEARKVSIAVTYI